MTRCVAGLWRRVVVGLQKLAAKAELDGLGATRSGDGAQTAAVDDVTSGAADAKLTRMSRYEDEPPRQRVVGQAAALTASAPSQVPVRGNCWLLLA